MAVISYDIKYEAEFFVPCVFRDNLEGECAVEEVVGSGDIMEGSGDESDGSNINTDMDFNFDDDDRDSESDEKKYLALRGFGKRLKEVTSSKKQQSEKLFQTAQLIYKNVTEKKRQWDEIKPKIAIMNKFVEESKSFKRLRDENIPVFEVTHKQIEELNELVSHQVNLTQSKSLQAVIKAEKKVKEMQSRKKNEPELEIEGSADYDDDDEGDDDVDIDGETDITSAIAKITIAKSKVNSFKELRRETPINCENVQDRMRKIQSDIAQLKHKVNRARFILSSLQLPVSIDSSSYIESKIDGRSDELSALTTIDVCFKPTVDDGAILFLQGNNSESYMLKMESGKLNMVVKNVGGSAIDELKLDETFEIDKWYNVKLKRTGFKFNMSVKLDGNKDSDASEESVAKEIKDIDFYQRESGAVIIGADPTATNFWGITSPSTEWSGCISRLTVNNKNVPLFLKTTSGKAEACDSKCSPNKHTDDNIRFEGDGFIEFPAKLFYRKPTVTSVAVDFRTRQESAFIMSIFHTLEKFHLEVTLSRGALKIKTTTPVESILLETQIRVNDDQYHSLKIEYRDSTTYPILDGRDGLFSIERQGRYHIRRDGILLGGRHRKHSPTDQTSRPNLIGCLQNVRINNEKINIYQMIDYNNIYIGPCMSHNLWRGCVEFLESSTPITFKDITELYLLAIAIKNNSKGPLLHFTKESKFDLQLSVGSETLDLVETVKSFKAEIKLPNRTFIPLIVQDDAEEKTLTVSILGEERTIVYGGDGWFTRDKKDKDAKYSFTIGAHTEDSTRQFYGAVTQVIYKNKELNLGSFIESNRLRSCNRDSQQKSLSTETRFASCR